MARFSMLRGGTLQAASQNFKAFFPMPCGGGNPPGMAVYTKGHIRLC
jgi:hypothetical protein